MIYLLWALLNIVILICSFLFSIRVFKTIHQQYGLLMTFLFCFILLSLLNHPKEKETDKIFYLENKTKNIELAANETIKQVVIENNILNKTRMHLNFRTRNDSIKPYKASFFTKGFICGTNWKAIMVVINPCRKNNQFKYDIEARQEWKLMGITFYVELETYRGLIQI